jgi:ribokinase
LIAVFGSIVLDVVTAVAELPRPGQTVLTDSYQLLPGGKGANQALAASRAGGQVRFIGSVGDDAFADAATSNLDAAGIDLSDLEHTGKPTACAMVTVDRNGENQIIVANSANLETSASQLRQRPLGSGDICLMQMEIPAPENWHAVWLAHVSGARTVLNAAPFAPIPRVVLEGLDVLIVNEVEATMLAHQLELRDTGYDGLTVHLADEFNMTAIVTLGADGAVASNGMERLTASAIDIDVSDTVGAGDAFVGAYVAAWDRGLGLADCLRWGSVAGGLACMAPGAQEAVPDAARITPHLSEVAISAF